MREKISSSSINGRQHLLKLFNEKPKSYIKEEDCVNQSIFNSESKNKIVKDAADSSNSECDLSASITEERNDNKKADVEYVEINYVNTKILEILNNYEYSYINYLILIFTLLTLFQSKKKWKSDKLNHKKIWAMLNGEIIINLAMILPGKFMEMPSKYVKLLYKSNLVIK